MNRYIYILLINFLYLQNYAQIIESFSDTSLERSVTLWKGQINDFKINSEHQLQSIGNVNGFSVLYTSFYTSLAMEWECWLKLNFAPSESNRLRIYLQANDTVFSKADAYYLEIGDNGSADAIKFYRQSGGKAVLLAEGTSGAMANDPALVRLKINRSTTGTWTLAADYKGERNFIEEWMITDTALKKEVNQYFGILCMYTPTRKDKFLFDDISVHRDTLDKIPLKISRISADSNQVRLYLNGPVDSLTANNEENYVLSNGAGQPRKAVLLQDSIVVLTLLKNLIPGDYQIICKTFKDRAGNTWNNLRATWTYILNPVIRPYELLVNEIMIDPTPTVKLPPNEYIEIYNHSGQPLDLSKVSLKFESNRYTIDTAILMLNAGEYLILCESTGYESLKSLGKTYRMKKWPALRNTTGTIALYDSKDSLIHQVVYEDTWYRDAKKKEGGWSLEMITPDNVCDKAFNWIAAIDITGGTPGRANSVYDTTYRIPLSMDSILVINDQTINLYPNKLIQLYPARNFIFNPAIAVNAIGLLYSPDKITLSLAESLTSGILYHLKISLSDCIGRSMKTLDTVLIKNDTIGLNDLVISEILFNPSPGGSDFIEMYNRSNKILSPDKMIISNEITGKQQSLHNNALILPGTYWVMSPKPDIIKQNYIVHHPEQMISTILPSLEDDHGQVSIWSRNRVLIDSCTYDQKYHYGLLNTQDGVTLERIDLEAPPLSGNWHSASGSSGYGTPTDKNSVNKSNSGNLITTFKLNHNVFSPNNDGIEDELAIDYTLPENGYLARIDIYDDQGRPVKRLISNLSLAYTGSIAWDGKDDNGRVSPSGIYIIAIEAIHEHGEHLREHLACVLER